MLTSKSNATFSQTNSNQSKCSAWLKDQNRCCERVIAKADRDERDSLLALLTVGGVYAEEQAQKFVDLHFCRNWHRRGGKHAFIRNPDDGWQVFQKVLQEGYSVEQDIFSADAPIPNRDPARNGGGFSEFTTSNFNQASARSQATPLRMSTGIWENPISPMTDLPYSAAEIQHIPISLMTSWADLPHSTETAPHSDERITPSSGASPPPVMTPVTEVLRRSARIQARQRLPLRVPGASALGPSSVTTASSVPTPLREVLPNAQGPSQATRTSIPTAPIIPPASRHNLRRSVRIQERTPATESDPSLPESVAPEGHSRMTENKDHPHWQRNHLTVPRSSQASRHFLTPRQSALASRSTNDAQPAQSPLPSARLSADGNTASREVELNEECTICTHVLGRRDRVKRCSLCLADVHDSCLAEWLCESDSRQACIFW
jgi:hypothetical protein